MLEMKPLCRDDTVVSVQWRPKRKRGEEEERHRTTDRNFVFIVEVESNETEFKHLVRIIKFVLFAEPSSEKLPNRGCDSSEVAG